MASAKWGPGVESDARRLSAKDFIPPREAIPGRDVRTEFAKWLHEKTQPVNGKGDRFVEGFLLPTGQDTIKTGIRFVGGVSTFMSDLLSKVIQVPADGMLSYGDRDTQSAAVDWMDAVDFASDMMAWTDPDRVSRTPDQRRYRGEAAEKTAVERYGSVVDDLQKRYDAAEPGSPELAAVQRDAIALYDTDRFVVDAAIEKAKEAFRTSPTDLGRSIALGVRDLVGMPFGMVMEANPDSALAFPGHMLFDGDGWVTRDNKDSVYNELSQVAGFVMAPYAKAKAKARAVVRQADKGGDNFTQSRGLFAGDKVPPTIFGIPVVSREEDYTEADLAFFEEHPEAGGYYDTGDSSPDDGSAEGAPVQADYPMYYGTRTDGSFKGTGWLGELPLKGGGVATEYSIGVNLNGKETDIPTLVPTLTKEEVKAMTQDIIPGGKPVPEAIVRKAAEHAKARIAKGQSVWANDGEPWSGDNAWSLRFEVPPERVVGADGSVRYDVHYDNYGHYDIGGYTSYWSFKNNHLIEHSNGGSIPEKSFVKGIEEKDRYLRKLADDVYRAYGVDPKKLPEGTKTAVRDINFSVKGGTLLPAKSPTFAGIVRDMRKSGATPEDAFAVAMALEQDTYGMVQKGSRKVHNYVRHANRGDLAARALLESKNPAVRSLGEAYAKSAGFTGGSGYDNSQKEVRFGHSWADFSTRMREVAKVADRMKLKYTGWTK